MQLFDSFTGTLPLLFICFFELIGVAWVYGTKRFSDDLTYMLLERPGWFWTIMWRFVSPVIVLAIFVSSIVNLAMKPPAYSVWRPNKAEVESVPYPSWCYPIIAFLICASCLCIPAVFLVNLCQRFIAKRRGYTP